MQKLNLPSHKQWFDLNRPPDIPPEDFTDFLALLGVFQVINESKKSNKSIESIVCDLLTSLDVTGVLNAIARP